MRLWVLVVALGGCGRYFGLDSPVLVDAAPPDAPLCIGASVTCANADVLRSCSIAGELPVDTPCAWGCLDTPAPHCAEVVPSGGAVRPDDVTADPALVDVILDGVTIQSGSGQIASVTTTIRNPGEGISNGIAYELRGSVGVFRFKSITFRGNPVIGAGSQSIALISDGPVQIDVMIDMRGTCANNNAGPGGFPGGPRGQAAAGNGGGGRGAANNEGGGGGGYGGDGGDGGNVPANGGVIFGAPRIPSLIGGGGGGGGGDLTNGSVGGGGGGALQIVSNAEIAITTKGGVNAGGCGGKTAVSSGAGGGGGAGGAILLEAPRITIDGGLAVNGGGGAGGSDMGQEGAAGLLGRVATPGGLGGGGGGGAGGNGAAGAALDGANGVAGQRSGGGGGAIGRMRFSTRSGVVVVSPTAVMSPSFADNTTATQSTADVQ